MKTTINLFSDKKKSGQKITMLTCYDYSTASFLAESEIDSILVGDTLGMVVQGQENTLSTTVDEMIYHTKAVKRGAANKFIITDMPFLSYHISTEDAVFNAGRIIKESQAEAVKLEGGQEIIDKIKAIIAAKIPVMGHLGLTPQSINLLGGFKVQGKTREIAQKIIEDALLLEESGVFAIVLECVPFKLAELISKKLTIPTIGIGSGNQTDGQVLVINDALGYYKNFTPKFVKKYADLGGELLKGVQSYISEVESQQYPGPEYSFKIDEQVIKILDQEF